MTATLSVRGSASVPVEPDEATVTITLSGVRAAPDEAYRHVGERAEAFEQLCDELGIEPAQRSTVGLAVQAEVEWVEGRNEPRGYRATSTTSVRMRDASLVARLLEQAVAQVDAHFGGPWWSVDLDNPARLEACRRAAASARQRAEAYAESLGVRLGLLAAVAEPGTAVRPGPRGAQAGFASIDEVPIVVQPGEQMVTAAIELTYELEQP